MRPCPIIAVCLLLACTSPAPTAEVLSLARLASLPASPCGVQARTRGNLFGPSGAARVDEARRAVSVWASRS